MPPSLGTRVPKHIGVTHYLSLRAVNSLRNGSPGRQMASFQHAGTRLFNSVPARRLRTAAARTPGGIRFL